MLSSPSRELRWPLWRALSQRADSSQPNIVFVIADDWSWPHASVYGDRVVQTPNFDRVAREGVLFTNAYCAAPTCTPSRNGILTGQAIHRLEDGANLFGILPKKFVVYPDLLERGGYVVGHERKGWAPGAVKASGRPRNPAGPRFSSFGEFLEKLPAGRPFCYWFGATDPHRNYQSGSGLASGLKLEDVTVPSYLPDTYEVRLDILDYYFAVQRMDRDLGALLSQLEAHGQSDNTLVVVTSDNGWPFPRGKANLYDAGCRMPLAIRWPRQIKGGTVVDAFVSATDFAPTFLEAAGLVPPREMTGRSLLNLLRDQNTAGRDKVFLERERHANCREGNLSYPSRGVRTTRYLYIRNLRPDRWPAGDPHIYPHGALGIPFGDIDDSPTRELIKILRRHGNSAVNRAYRLGFEKRPAEELYDLSEDPHQVRNVAGRPEYTAVQRELRASLDRWMLETDDPRARSDDDRFDGYAYYGPLLGEPYQYPN